MVVHRRPAAAATPRCEQFDACLDGNGTWARRGECCAKFWDDKDVKKYRCQIKDKSGHADNSDMKQLCSGLKAWAVEDLALEYKWPFDAFDWDFISKAELKAACDGWCDAGGTEGDDWCTYKNMSACLASPEKVETRWGECCGRYPGAWEGNWSRNCSIRAEPDCDWQYWGSDECGVTVLPAFAFERDCGVKTGPRLQECDAFCNSVKALPTRSPDASIQFRGDSFYYEVGCLALPELRKCLVDGDVGTCCAVHSRAAELIEECRNLSTDCQVEKPPPRCKKYCENRDPTNWDGPTWCAGIEYDECRTADPDARGKCCALVPNTPAPTPTAICLPYLEADTVCCGPVPHDCKSGARGNACLPYAGLDIDDWEATWCYVVGKEPTEQDYSTPEYYCSFNHVLAQDDEIKSPTISPEPLRDVCDKYLRTGTIDCDLDVEEEELKDICTTWCNNLPPLDPYWAHLFSGCKPGPTAAYEKCVYGDPGKYYGEREAYDHRDWYDPSRDRWLRVAGLLPTYSDTEWSCCGKNPTAPDCVLKVRYCAALYSGDGQTQLEAFEDGLDDYDDVTDHWEEALDSLHNFCRALCSGYEDEPQWCDNVPSRKLGPGDIAAIVLGVVCFLLIGGGVVLLVLYLKKPGVAPAV